MTAAPAQPGPPAWRRWLALAAGLYLLNLALAFHNDWPTPWVEDRHEFSVEIAVLVLALAVWAELVRVPSRRVMTVLAALLTLMTVARYADVTAPALYGRTVNLYWDAQHLPKVAGMLLEVTPAWLVALGVMALVLLLALVFGLLRWALEQLRLAMAQTVPRRALAAAGAGLVAIYGVGIASDALKSERWFSRPLVQTYAAQAVFVADALSQDGAAVKLPPSPDVVSDLARARGADVVVLFLESYGAVADQRADLAAALVPARADLAAAIEQTGRGAVSAYVRSPTFGGNSWLAHASLLSGIEVGDGRAYKLLLTQQRDTLVQRFERGGYRTIGVMPGLRMAWPEGAFYGFDRLLDADALQYAGPAFGWWRIPDQLALARLDEWELSSGTEPPRFVVFPTISTHLPFRPTPPYQPDWSRMLTPQPYDPETYRKAVETKPDWTSLGPAYADSLGYAFTYLAGYLRHRPASDLILVVLGDHQPPAAVSGEGASWLVPVHVIASRPAILDALADADFARGMTPREPALGPMHELYGVLLRALDSRQ